MKLYKPLYIISFSILFAGCFNGYGQQVNNPHEFSADTWDFTEWCNPCHVYSPEIDTSSGDFLISYESDSITSTDSVYISGISKLCFTCHDGTVATFSHSTSLSQSNTSIIEGIANPHPVSVFYPAEGPGNLKLHNPKTTLSGLGGTIAEDMLKNGRVECTSCHDPHFSMQTTPCGSCPTADSYQQGNDKPISLLKTNKNGVLCLTCHNL